METHVLETDRAAITYDVSGSGGRPLMMIGQPMDASGFVALRAQFPDRTVITYDPRGIGRSTRSDGRTDNTHEIQAADVHAVIGPSAARSTCSRRAEARSRPSNSSPRTRTTSSRSSRTSRRSSTCCPTRPPPAGRATAS
jgi:hypothetical protein